MIALQSIRLYFISTTLTWKLLDLIELWTQIYSLSALTLFCFVSWVIIDCFGIIRKEVDDVLGMINRKQSQSSIIRRLRHLQRQHELLCRCADFINCIFGPILLFQIPFVFIGVINSFLNVFFNFKDRFGGLGDYLAVVSTLSFIVSHFVNFSMLCNTSDNLRNAVGFCPVEMAIILFHVSTVY